MRISNPIQGDRIRIRNYEATDLDFVTDMWLDEENGKYLSDPTRDFVDEAFQRALDELPDSKLGYYFVIERADTGERIGSACAFPDETRRTYDIGYCIRKAHWNSGYGTQAVAALLQWLREMGACAVTAEVAVENTASCALLRRLGFAVEKQTEFQKYHMDIRFASYLYRKTLSPLCCDSAPAGKQEETSMKLYHMSETLQLGDHLKPDYQRCTDLALPFVQALEQSVDCFYAMALNGKYLRAVLGKFKLREWSNYCKWSVEGAFEYIRKTEFPHCCSRLHCNYFYDTLESCRSLYEYDWGQASKEEQAAIHLYEVELHDDKPQKRDMRLYDEAYNAMSEREDVQFVLSCARRYFAGEQSENPVWEVMSDQPAIAVRDATDALKKEK